MQSVECPRAFASMVSSCKACLVAKAELVRWRLGSGFEDPGKAIRNMNPMCAQQHRKRFWNALWFSVTAEGGRHLITVVKRRNGVDDVDVRVETMDAVTSEVISCFDFDLGLPGHEVESRLFFALRRDGMTLGLYLDTLYIFPGSGQITLRQSAFSMEMMDIGSHRLLFLYRQIMPGLFAVQVINCTGDPSQWAEVGNEDHWLHLEAVMLIFPMGSRLVAWSMSTNLSDERGAHFISWDLSDEDIGTPNWVLFPEIKANIPQMDGIWPMHGDHFLVRTYDHVHRRRAYTSYNWQLKRHGKEIEHMPEKVREMKVSPCKKKMIVLGFGPKVLSYILFLDSSDGTYTVKRSKQRESQIPRIKLDSLKTNPAIITFYPLMPRNYITFLPNACVEANGDIKRGADGLPVKDAQGRAVKNLGPYVLYLSCFDKTIIRFGNLAQPPAGGSGGPAA